MMTLSISAAEVAFCTGVSTEKTSEVGIQGRKGPVHAISEFHSGFICLYWLLRHMSGFEVEFWQRHMYLNGPLPRWFRHS
jgi:hypothetical protein